MSGSLKNLPEKNDELDLIELLGNGILFLKKYGKIILITVIIILALGIARYTISPKIYGSTMIMHSFMLTNQEYLSIIENWNQLLKKKEYAALEKLLNCPAKTLRKVTFIEAEEIQKIYSQNPNGFIINVKVKDTSVLTALRNAIVYGLENGSYVKEKLESKRANLKELINKVRYEIAKLDSTKSNIESSIIKRSGTVSSLFLDISGINSQMIYLNEKYINYQEDLKFSHAVEVYQDFLRFNKPIEPSLFKTIIISIAAGLILGYIIALFKYINTKLKQRYQQHNTSL